jgi:hypothetical protein
MFKVFTATIQPEQAVAPKSGGSLVQTADKGGR